MAAGASAVVLVERGFRAVRCDGCGFDGNTNLSSIGTAADINAQGGRPESSRTVEKRGKGFEMGISTHVYTVYGVRVIGMRHHSGKFILDGHPDGFPVTHLRSSRAGTRCPSRHPRTARTVSCDQVS